MSFVTWPTTPATMQAAQWQRIGEDGHVHLCTLPTPQPSANEVLVRVRGAGLNPKDHLVLTRAADRVGVGFDVAGEVAALGSGIHDLSIGDPVWGFLDGRRGGAAAEYVVMRRAWLSAMPATLDWDEAAAMPLASCTALQALRDVAKVQPGDRVLIKGAAGGVGSAAIQIAKAFGAHVTAVVRGDGLDRARSLGADTALEMSALHAGSGRYDIFLDCAGATRYRTMRALLAPGSRWVTVAPNRRVFMLAPLSPILAMLSGMPRFGFVMVRPRSADLATIADLVARGLLRMPIAERFPLDCADDAYRALQRRGVYGKRVVTITLRESDTKAMQRPPQASSSSRAIRDRVEALLAGQRVPGASIAVVDRGGLRWADGFGHADIATSRPARSDTVYHLFSGTKLFTAVAVLQLAERGLLSLGEEIGNRLPEAGHLPGVTVAHLLSHRSGLRDTMRGFLATTFPDAPAPTAEEALGQYRLRAARAPGQRVEYGNVNYALLGVLIERVTGESFPTYVERNILRPLGMAGGFTLAGAEHERLATGYMDRVDPMRVVLHLLDPAVSKRLYAAPAGSLVALKEYHLSTAAIGGLLGSVEDFARFLHAQLTDGGGVLSVASVASMQRMVAEGAAGIESRVGVALGWKVGRSGERTFLNHEGAGAGFTSELRLYPDEGVGVAIAMNAMRMPRTMRLAHRIAEAVLDG